MEMEMFKVNQPSEFELRRQIADAVKKGKYLITVTVYDPETHQLQHHYSMKYFPIEDAIPSLEHLAGQIDENNAKNWPPPAKPDTA